MATVHENVLGECDSLAGRSPAELVRAMRADCPAVSTDDGAAEPIAADVLEPAIAPGLGDLVELILKDRPRLERIIRDPALAAEAIPSFLAIALAGFTLFGIATAIILRSVGIQVELGRVADVLSGAAPSLIAFRDLSAAQAGWLSRMAANLRMIAAYDLGLIAAAGVCLPSLYFYGLLAGVPMSMSRVTVHSLKALAVSAVALVGILPIYMAFSLGAAVFHLPRVLTEAALWLGLVLPFVAGLWGVESLYRGFTALAQLLPADRRCSRACLLRRLVVSWSVCSTAVTPVMIHTLWEYFSR